MKLEAITASTVSGMFEEFVERVKAKGASSITEENIRGTRSLFYSGIMECVFNIVDLKKQQTPDIVMAIIMDRWITEIEEYAKSLQATNAVIKTAQDKAKG